MLYDFEAARAVVFTTKAPRNGYLTIFDSRCGTSTQVDMPPLQVPRVRARGAHTEGVDNGPPRDRTPAQQPVLLERGQHNPALAYCAHNLRGLRCAHTGGLRSCGTRAFTRAANLMAPPESPPQRQLLREQQQPAKGLHYVTHR